jgi:nitrous-oxide reductase
MSTNDEDKRAAGRRNFLRASSVLGAAAVVGCGSSENGAGAGAGTGPGAGGTQTPTPPSTSEGLSSHVEPGQLDDYYGFWSGGQSGEIRILGVPSMREFKRIPVFNRESATGHGATDWTKQAMGGMHVGDTHHVHLSYTDGTYDGRYIYVNDKANARLARVRCDVMETDAIVEIPNSQGTHGIFPQRHRTGLVFCNSEFQIPTPNDGSVLDDPSQYYGLHTAVDGESMEVRWQVKVPGNMDLAATDYQGNYSFATCYNSERGVHLEEMMSAERDWLYVFNLAEIQRAVDAGETTRIGSSQVPVVDATADTNPFVMKIPVAKSPHGVNIDPTGHYAVVAGKLSPTGTVVDITKIADAFAGRIEPRECVVAEPELGPGTAPYGLRRSRKCVHLHLHRLEHHQVEHRERHPRPRGRRGRAHRQPRRRPLPGRAHERLHERDARGRRSLADRAVQVLEGPLPERGAAQAGERPTHRHLGRDHAPRS